MGWAPFNWDLVRESMEREQKIKDTQKKEKETPKETPKETKKKTEKAQGGS